MKIFKIKHKNNYTCISNQIIQNESLSFEARGLLSYLLSLPTEWAVSREDLINRSPNAKRKRINAIISELERFGYIHKIKHRDVNGRVARVEYNVYEQPKGVI